MDSATLAGDDAFGEELLTPVLIDRGDARVKAKSPAFSISDDKARETPVLADDDIVEIKEFLARKDWIDEKIKVRSIRQA